MTNIGTFLRPGAPMFGIGAFLFVLLQLSSYFELPTPDRLLDILRPLFSEYGNLITFVAYLIESIFAISFYWPGSFVAFVAILLSPHSFASLFAVWLTLNLAAFVGFALDCILAKTGLFAVFRAAMSERLFDRVSALIDRRGAVGFLLLGFHVNWLAIAVVASAIFSSYGFRRIVGLACLSHAGWSAVLVYFLSFITPQNLSNPNIGWVVIGLFFAGGFALVFAEKRLTMNAK